VILSALKARPTTLRSASAERQTRSPAQRAALRYAAEILSFTPVLRYSVSVWKLDIVGLPDFEAGAHGKYRGDFLIVNLCFFIDDKNSSVDSHQAVF